MENVDKIKRGEPVKDPDKIVSARELISAPVIRLRERRRRLLPKEKMSFAGNDG